jgi:hypothetical protein
MKKLLKNSNKLASVSVVNSQKKEVISQNKPTVTVPKDEIAESEISAFILNNDKPLEVEQISDLDRKNKIIFLSGVIFTSFIISLSVIIFILSGTGNFKSTDIKKPTITEILTPSPTNTPTFIRSDVTFEVLNGSGVKGAAKNAAIKLEALGYRVINTGNSSKVKPKSQVFVSQKSNSFETLILADLTNEFGVSSVSGVPVDTTASAQLVIGQK